MHRKYVFAIYSQESMKYCNVTDILLIMFKLSLIYTYSVN